jgi:glycosyltransferase involved in cell wall biosynthesis
MRVATNIFNSPENTGPGNFARRLAPALVPFGIELVPSQLGCDLFFANAFIDQRPMDTKKTILRVDGLGAGSDFKKVEIAHKCANVVIYQSEYSKGLLHKTHNFTPEKSYVIHNGVPIPKLERLNKSYENEFVSICNTWNEHRYKNFVEVVYKMMPELKHCVPNFSWTIVGKHELFKEAMPDADKLPIKFIGFRPDISICRQIAKGAIHIVPTDSCPNSVIESLSHGVPCIVWHDSAGPELIGQAGVVLYGKDPHEIVKAVQELGNNGEKYSALARQRAEECLDIKVAAAKYAEVFHGAA